MMTSRTTEIWVGLFMAGGFVALFMLAMKVSNLSTYTDDNGFEIEARFQNATGLKVRSPVEMAGVRIGRVTEIAFDKENFEAVITMRINSNYDNLPDDTQANVYTAGLLGEKYIGLIPGAGTDPCEEEKLLAELEGRAPNLEGKDCGKQFLSEGSMIKKTQSSLVLEELIARFVANFADKQSQDQANK